MAKFRSSAMAFGFAVTMLGASSALAIESEEDCEFEGGDVITIQDDVVCLVPVRHEDFHDEVYDGQQLGIKECAGESIADGQFCKVVLEKGEVKTYKTKEEAEAAAKAEAEAEMKGEVTTVVETEEAVEVVEEPVMEKTPEVVKKAPKKKKSFMERMRERFDGK